MAVDSEKTAWLVQLGILEPAMAESLAPPRQKRSKSAPGSGGGEEESQSSSAEESTSADEAASAEETTSHEGGFSEQRDYSGTFTHTPPPAPPKPAPARPPAPPPVPEPPNMTPMDGDRPPGPWLDQMDTPNQTPSRPEANQSVEEAPEPTALGGGAVGVTGQYEFTIQSPPAKAWGGKIEIVWKLTFQATASFLPSEDEQIQFSYSKKEGIVRKAATSWPLEKVMKALGAPSLLNKSKFNVEGELSKEGVTIKAGFALETPFGSGEVSGVLVKIEHGKKPTFGQIELAYITPKIELGNWVEDNIQLGQASVTVKGSASIEPKWARVMAEELIKDAGIDAALETGAEAGAEASVEAGAEAGVEAGVEGGVEAGVEAGVEGGVEAGLEAGAGAGSGGAAVLEAAMAAGLAAVAVGTAIGVANMFVQKANMDNLKGSLAAAIRDLRGGLYDGAAGLPASGTGELYAQGHALGGQAYRRAIDLFVAKVGRPPIPSEIDAVRDIAGKAALRWPGLGQVEDRLRWGFFNRWVDENHGLGTFKGDAQEAVLWCFGVANEPSTGPHMQIWVAKSSLPEALKS